MAQPPKSLRILHLASSERWTGVAEPVVSLAREQQRIGHQVWVGCVPGRSFERKTRERGIAIAEGFHLNRRLNPLHLLSDLFLLRRFCRSHSIDIIHTHLLHDHWLAATSLKWLFPRRPRPLLLRTVHSSAPLRADWMHRRLFCRYTDRFVCISSAAAREAEETLNLPAGSVPFIQGGVDLERFRPGLDPAEIRTQLGIPAEAPVAAIVARMRAGRGLRWLMQAIPQVLERVPNAYFFVVGRGELKHWFKAEIRKPIYKDRVKYAGYRTTDLPQSYAAMDVSLFLGLGSEGTCRAILEAMACGRPTIGVNKGAVPEIIEDGRTGLLVRDRDMKNLVDKLTALLDDRSRCAQMGTESRRLIEQRFHESRRAEAFESIYGELLAQQSNAHE